jgi:energy-coupling factor transporter transmembrane protein EcfT
LPDVHPLIRLVLLLTFTAAMALAHPVILAGGSLLLLLTLILAGFPEPRALLRMLLRLRWLFLALLLVYGWWTPGHSLWPSAAAWSPTVEGLQLGGRRILVLMAIVAAVHLLLQTTPRERLLPALMQLLKPFSTESMRSRLAVRMVLVMETVPRVQTLVGDTLRQTSPTTRFPGGLATAAQRIYANVLRAAERESPHRLELQPLSLPPAWQWLLPLVLVLMVLVATRL